MNTNLTDEMFEFFAFREALGSGFSPEAVIEEQIDQAQAQVIERINTIAMELTRRAEESDRLRENLLTEIAHVDLQFTKEQCEQHQRTIDDLKQKVKVLSDALTKVEKATGEFNDQNRELLTTVQKMKEALKNKKTTFPNQASVNQAGQNLCLYLSNPERKQYNGTNKYPQTRRPNHSAH